MADITKRDKDNHLFLYFGFPFLAAQKVFLCAKYLTGRDHSLSFQNRKNFYSDDFTGKTPTI